MSQSRINPRVVAACVTALIAAVVVLWLLMSRLHFTPPEGATWPPEPYSEILMADEYVEVIEMPLLQGGDNADAAEGAPSAPPEGLAPVDAGQPADMPSPVNTQVNPSEVKENPAQPDRPTGPAQSEVPQANPSEQRRNDARNDAQNMLRFHPGADNTGSGEATQGSGAGNAPTAGTHGGRVGRGNLGGRTLSVPSVSQKSSRPGKVVVRIFVNREGIQTQQPRILSNTTGDKTIESDCLRIARGARVSPSVDAPAEQYADIEIIYQ